LIGKSSAELTIASADITATVPTIFAALPSELLERQVAAANAQIGVAKAALTDKVCWLVFKKLKTNYKRRYC
jgi:hypothetical protein